MLVANPLLANPFLANPFLANPSCAKPAELLLDWYDRHRRDLPWRAKPGERQAPYRVWLSEIMLQQTTVEAVKPYYARFLARWPDVEALASADEQALLAAWAGLGYYARARNLLACAKMIARELGGYFPDTEAGLRALPGIGAYTAAAIVAIAFDQPALVVDGNVERVMSRLAAIETPLPASRPDIREALATIAPSHRPGDFAQAIMDLGATICTPKSPACALCPLQPHCAAFSRQNPTDYPRKLPKKARPVKIGMAYVVFDPDGRILLRTRPAKGLLASMAEVPTSDWVVLGEDEILPTPPFSTGWQTRNMPLISLFKNASLCFFESIKTQNAMVVHVFTHFELRLGVQVARLARAAPPPDGHRWVPADKLDSEPLPTLMRKVIECAHG